MPYVNVNGADIYYEDQGTGPETIVFAHGLLWSGQMFAPQVKALKDRYRCITFDFRGQGKSQVTDTGYDIETLTLDAKALIETLKCAPCHFAGLSMGGFVAMRLGIEHPHLVKSILLLETSADPEPEENMGRYRFLNFMVRWFGFRLVAGQVMPIMFGHKFLTDPNRAELRGELRERMIANHRIGISRAVNGVINRIGVYDRLDRITAPTLIIVGDQDTATVPAKSERMQARIPGSQLKIIPGAGHSSTLEEPEAVTTAILEFLTSLKTSHLV